MYYIYCHLFPNGKRYIGITSVSPERRWGNGKNYSTCPLINRAILKYGWENVKHDIIDTVESKEEAETKEQYYISLFRSNESKYGYNVLPGGNVANNPLTDEIRYKLGNGQRGKQRTEKDKYKISAGVRETFSRPESNGHFGMNHTMETRLKMSVSQLKRWSKDKSLRVEASERMRRVAEFTS